MTLRDCINTDESGFRMLCDALLAKEAEAHEVLALRAEHGLNNEYDRTHMAAPQKTPKKLSSLINKFVSLHTGRSKARSKQKPEEAFSKIIELLGNPYTYEISQDMLIAFFDELARYPKYRNHPHIKNLTLEQCRYHPKYEPISCEEFVHQRHINHGRFVDNKQVGLERVVLAALEAETLGVELQQAVNSLCLKTG